jgi:hypothetical protein
MPRIFGGAFLFSGKSNKLAWMDLKEIKNRRNAAESFF